MCLWGCEWDAVCDKQPYFDFSHKVCRQHEVIVLGSFKCYRLGLAILFLVRLLGLKIDLNGVELQFKC